MWPFAVCIIARSTFCTLELDHVDHIGSFAQAFDAVITSLSALRRAFFCKFQYFPHEMDLISCYSRVE